MSLINKIELKRRFEEQEIKIGKKAADKFILIQEKNIVKDIEVLKRKASLSGRKVIRKEDFEDV